MAAHVESTTGFPHSLPIWATGPHLWTPQKSVLMAGVHLCACGVSRQALVSRPRRCPPGCLMGWSLPAGPGSVLCQPPRFWDCGRAHCGRLSYTVFWPSDSAPCTCKMNTVLPSPAPGPCAHSALICDQLTRWGVGRGVDSMERGVWCFIPERLPWAEIHPPAGPRIHWPHKHLLLRCL